jgi:hypothetical protein
MLDFLSKALEWLSSPKRWATVFIFCVALLLLSPHVAEWMRIADLRDKYRPWLGLLSMFSGTVLVVEVASWLRTPLASFQQRRNQKTVLLALTPPEMRVISEYFRQQTDTLYFSATDGVTGGLTAKGLLYQSSNVSRGLSPDFGFNLQPWVRETVRKHPAILPTLTLLGNRKSNTR